MGNNLARSAGRSTNLVPWVEKRAGKSNNLAVIRNWQEL
jgi:hypothetical protein